MTATVVRARLISLNLVTSGTSGGSDWVCLVGGLNDSVNAPQVAVMDTTGLSPLMSHGASGPLRPAFQVLVRGVPHSYAATSAKALAVWDALHRTAWGDFLTVEGVTNPVWVGLTLDDGRPTWSMNFLTIQQ